MRKILLATLLFALTTQWALSAVEGGDRTHLKPLNGVGLNFLGDASILSLYYDRFFPVSPSFRMSSKLGVGGNQEFCLMGSCGSVETFVTLPHHLTGNIGKGRHFFEFGLGGTVIMGNTDQHYLLYPMLGYRFWPLISHKAHCRVFVQMPFTGLDTQDIGFVPVGFSLGVSF